jgi:hypothetical protein
MLDGLELAHRDVFLSLRFAIDGIPPQSLVVETEPHFSPQKRQDCNCQNSATLLLKSSLPASEMLSTTMFSSFSQLALCRSWHDSLWDVH